MSIRVAFILGCGFSGTTLLDLILGSHSRMIGLGEIHANAFDAFLDENQICTCLFKARECHFWGKVLKLLHQYKGEESFRLAPVNGSSSDGIVQNTTRLFQAIKEVSSAEILVDSSKRTRRAHLLVESGLIQSKVIHLVRDGRAVAYSYVKRGHRFRQAVSQWKETNIAIRDWMATSRAPDHLSVRYEDLCAQPIETSRRICEFLGLGWEAKMMSFGQKTHHNVRGNPMRFSISDSEIKLDETWRDHLGDDDLDLFEELAGSLSLQLGYDLEVRADAPLSTGSENKQWPTESAFLKAKLKTAQEM